MRQRALFVTSKAAWRRNKMLPARENVDSPLAAMVLATEHKDAKDVCISSKNNFKKTMCQSTSLSRDQFYSDSSFSSLKVSASFSLFRFFSSLRYFPSCTNTHGRNVLEIGFYRFEDYLQSPTPISSRIDFYSDSDGRIHVCALSRANMTGIRPFFMVQFLHLV